jgi:hypothetical protein
MVERMLSQKTKKKNNSNRLGSHFLHRLTWQEHFHPDMVERDGNVRKRMVAREGKNGRNIWVGRKKKKKAVEMSKNGSGEWV